MPMPMREKEHLTLPQSAAHGGSSEPLRVPLRRRVRAQTHFIAFAQYLEIKRRRVLSNTPGPLPWLDQLGHFGREDEEMLRRASTAAACQAEEVDVWIIVERRHLVGSWGSA
jgi:hypothetical protein